MINQEQFDEWKSHPVTQEIFKEIERVKVNLIVQLSSGLTIGATTDVTHGQTNRLVGHLEGLNQLSGITFADESTD